MFEFGNSQHRANTDGSAEVFREALERSVRRQSEKKRNLLLKSRAINHIIKGAEPLVAKVTERKTILSRQRENLLSNIEFWRKCDWTISGFSQVIEDINSNDIFKQYRGIIGVRKSLSFDSGIPIQQIIDANLVPRMIKFLQRKDEPQLQLEAAWALANVASGTTAQTQIVLDKGALPWLIQFLRSNNQELNYQAIWVLGNIAVDRAVFRDRILANGALQPLLKVFEDPNLPQHVIKHGTWAISSLCRGGPLPPLEKVRSAIPTLCKIIYTQTDVDTLSDAAWALSYLSRTDDAAQDLTNCPGAVSAFVSLLSNPYLALMIPCLKTVGHICDGNETQINAVISHPEFLRKIYDLIDHQKKLVKRDSLLILSNIAASGTEEQRNKVFQSFPFVEKLISHIETDVDEIKRQALSVFTNTFRHETISEFLTFWDAGVVNYYVNIVKREDYYTASILRVTLEGIYFMLKIGRKIMIENQSEQNMVLFELENRGALEKFDTLQDYNDEIVCEIVTKIIKDFMPSIKIRPRTRQIEDIEEEFDNVDEIN